MTSLRSARPCGVVFDLDGTLVDSYAAISDSLNHARAGFDLPALPQDEIRRTVGRGLESLIADLVGPDHVEHGVALFRERYALVYADLTRVLPGVDATVSRLAALGFPMTVASNKPARFSDPILRSVGLRAHFRAVHGPDTVGATKPDPAMIRRCAVDMGIGVDSVVYVGDMVLDVESADRAGVAVVLVPGGSSETAELAATGRPVLTSIRDLPDHLESSLARNGHPGV